MNESQDGYTVHLEAFEGPLDLLLHLIRKAEVDIVDISIADITDQFVAHLGQVDRLDIDLASEFLVMAATLMEVKSRLLAPMVARPSASTEDVEENAAAGASTPGETTVADLRSDLVRQLLAYQWARDAGDALSRLLDAWSRRWVSAPAHVDRKAIASAIAEQRDGRDLEDLSLFDLVAAYERVVQRVNFDLLGEHLVFVDTEDAPIETQAERLVDALRDAPVDERAGARVACVAELLADKARLDVIGMFLALLELLRKQIIGIVDADATDDVTVGSLRIALLDENAHGLDGGQAIEQTAEEELPQVAITAGGRLESPCASSSASD